MSPARAVPPAASAEPVAPPGFWRQVLAVAEADARKLRHDPLELLTRATQPALWLVVFGQVLARVRGMSPGGMPYLDFMAPGVLAQSALFTAIFYGISAIWERDLGLAHKLLVSPAPRSALVLGKATAAGVRALSQSAVVYLLALAMGIHVRLTWAALAGVTASVLLGAAVFSTLSLAVACLARTRERFMGIGQVLTMPLFFASNAVYPLDLMPGWLRAVAAVNPLTYEVDALRALMVQGGASAFGLGLDLAVLAGAAVVLVGVAARLYPRLAA